MAAVIANRVPPADCDAILARRRPAGARLRDPGRAAFSAPRVAEVARRARAPDGCSADDAAYARDVLRFVVGAAHVPISWTTSHDGALVIAPGDRADLVVATYGAHAAGAVALAGIMLTLGDRARRAGARPRRNGCAPTCRSASSSRHLRDRRRGSPASKAGCPPGHPRKVEAALGAFESHVDATGAVAARLDVARSDPGHAAHVRVRTHRPRPSPPAGMSCCRKAPRSGSCAPPRCCCAAASADLTLLGPVDDIARRIRELGLDTQRCRAGRPGRIAAGGTSSPTCTPAARQRRASRSTLARDMVADPNYFGTMMVHTGRADAMVSGATHTRRPTRSGPRSRSSRRCRASRVASSVFFMCLADQVLVYGDCAINPDPDPRAAGRHRDLLRRDGGRVRRRTPHRDAVLLDRRRPVTAPTSTRSPRPPRWSGTARPELLVDGPIQYDAAVDPDGGRHQAARQPRWPARPPC